MAHWSDRYIGRAYVEGEFDCGDLAALVRREVFGRELRLPSDHGEGPLGRTAAIQRHIAAYVMPTDRPQDGDGVLLIVRGRVQHIGLYCQIGTTAWVLHNQAPRKEDGDAKAPSQCGGGVILTRLRELARWGYEVEGFYRWI